MKRSLLLPLCASLLWVGTATAQHQCGANELLQREIASNPDRAETLARINQQTADYLAAHPEANRGGETIMIPIVYHVVYNAPEQNVSDFQIMEHLAQLNADMARTNSDAGVTPAAFLPFASVTNVQFCLAQRTPSGTASTGITRTATAITDFDYDEDPQRLKFTSLGGHDAWPRDSYLNYWICNLNGPVDGYGQFPGGAAATDGIVQVYTEIGSIANPGPSDQPHTAIHEVGHWLNLRHIWGDDDCGDDMVADTPTQFGPNSGCPTFPSVTCSNGPDGDMFCNFMDYTDEACTNMFSNGQSARMEANFAPLGARVSLLTSMGCVPGVAACPTTQLVNYPGITANSCGVSGKVVGSPYAAGKIWAWPSNSNYNPGSTGQVANRYEFEISNPASGYIRTQSSSNYALVLYRWNSNPLLCGTNTYNVRVRVSLDNGATYCPYGATCTVTITNPYMDQYCTSVPVAIVDGGTQQAVSTTTATAQTTTLWPNPNSGDRLFVNMTGLDANATTMTMDIHDLFGKRVMNSVLPVSAGMINNSVKLDDRLVPGMYIVRFSCGGVDRTERLMIQR